GGARGVGGGDGGCRRWVGQGVRRRPPQCRFVVIHGPTGSGKSRYLKNLQRSGEQVLDLEELAAHRGSVLGNLPGRPQPSQKMFESLLLQNILQLDAARPVFVVGESRKIGQLQVPEALIGHMRASPCVALETSVEARVELSKARVLRIASHREDSFAAAATRLLDKEVLAA